MFIVRQNKKFFFIAFLIAVVVLVRFSKLGHILNLESLKNDREQLLAIVDQHYVASIIAFIAVYILVVGLSIPGAEILTLGAGFLYGVLPAVIYVNVGATIGASIAFLSARFLAGNWLLKKYQRQLSAFNHEISRNGAHYLLSLRLLPVFPFFLINLLSGFTSVPFKTFVWTTAIGIIPGTAVFAYAGRQIGSINSVAGIFSAPVMIAFAVLALFAFVPVIIKRIKRTKNH